MTAVRRPLRAMTGVALTLALAVAATVATLSQPATAAPEERSSAADGAPKSLSVNGLARPVDVDTVPSFGWHVSTATQTAYEVVVARTADAAASGDGDVWSSGPVPGDQQTGVAYEGPALDDSQRYFWSVRTADADGVASPWADPATFGTGTAWEDSTPVWAPDPNQDAPADYTLSTTLTVVETAAGLSFRAVDDRNSYMWQFRADSNTVVPHRQVDGSYTALPAISLPAGTIRAGVPTPVEIEVVGSSITTRIGGQVVDTRTDSTHPRGGVGVRNGRTERSRLDDLVVRDAQDRTIVETSFEGGDRVFSCGTVADGALVLGYGAVCRRVVPSDDWAMIRSDVDVADKAIAWATLYATAADPRASRQYVHKVFLNGDFVGLGPTQPLASETPYDGFDVTGQLRRGATNTIASLAHTTRTQAFQAELVIAYADGTRQVVGSGTDWQARAAGDVYPEAGSIGTSYYSAPKENLDATAMPWGWDAPGYDASDWPRAVERSALPALTATPTDKVTEQLHEPVRIVEKGPGHYFVDFGRTWVGGVAYDVTGAGGESVDIRFGEVTNGRPGQAGDTDVRYRLNTGNEYRDVVTLREGEQRIETWGMRVFRYLEVRGAPEAVTAQNLQALALVYPFDAEASEFAASDQDLEDVYALSKNSIEALNVNFYTDSYTRERINYEADAYLQLMSTLYLMDDLSLGRYSMNYFENNRTWPTEWPIYVVLAVHDAWRQTGDLAQPAAYYENLVEKLPTEWLEPSTGLIRKDNGSDGCNSRTDCDIVDWPTSERDGYVFRPYNTVINAISYRAYTDMAAMADALGKQEDAERWTSIATGIRTSMNERMYDAATGSYVDGLNADGAPVSHRAQHASSFSLAFGVPEADQRNRVARFVGSRGMSCSVYCAGLLIPGLYQGGEGQAALDLLTDDGLRSWRNMIDLGAGSTAEAWDPSLKSNLTYSHPWAASPAFSIPSGLFGINPTEAGYRSLEVAPQPGDLAWARISTPTVRGSVGTAFDRDPAGDLRLAVSVPGGTSATVKVPTDAEAPVRLWVDGAVRTVDPVDGALVVSGVAPGCHTFTTDGASDPAADPDLTSICEGDPAVGPGLVADVTEAGSDGWYGEGAALVLDTTGDVPADARIEYAVSDGDWTTYDGPVTLAEGSYELAWRLVADDEVLTDGRTPVKVDPLAPEVDAGLDDGRLWMFGSDTGSGLGALEFSVDGAAWRTWSAPVDLPAGARTIRARAIDVAGNASPTRTLGVARLGSALGASVVVDRGGWRRVHVTVTAAGTTPSGRVDFYRGGERRATRWLDDGTATWRSRVPSRPRNQVLRIVYRGDRAVEASSRTVRYRVP